MERSCGSSAPWLIAVMGPTASGKTMVAELLAEQLGAQLVNADAFQVYRGFDIGTSKPANKDDYLLLDIKEPSDPFGVGEWVSLAASHLHDHYLANRNVVVVGGTGFYVRALFDQWTDLLPPPDPALRARLAQVEKEFGVEALVGELVALDRAAAQRVDRLNAVRVRRAIERASSAEAPIRFSLPPFRTRKVGLVRPVEELNRRIDERTVHMMASGWLDEVDALLGAGVQVNMPAMRAIGYIDLVQLVKGEIDRETAVLSIQMKTRQYAKRQRTWMRSEIGLLPMTIDREMEHNSGILWLKLSSLLGE